MKTNTCFTFLVVLLGGLTRLQVASTLQFTTKSYTVVESFGTETLTVQRLAGNQLGINSGQ